MDSKDREESKIRQREETLARRVGEALDQLNAQNAGECPDAEVIAAYAEQALGPAESSQWEGHFAACARCRKVLRVLAVSADTPLAEKEVARLGERISAVRAPVEITGKSAGRARPGVADWRMRWLAPAVGVAAVLAVWFAMRPPWRATDRGVSTTLIAQAPKEELPLSPAPQEADRFSRVAPQQKEAPQAAPPSERSSANGQALNSPVEGLKKTPADAGKALDRVSPSAREAASSLQQQEKLSALPNGREIQPPAISSPPPPPSKKRAETATQATPQSEAKAALATPAPAEPAQAGSQADAASSPAPEAPPSTSQSVTVTESVPLVEAKNGALSGPARQKPSADLPSNARNNKALATLRPTGKYSALLKAPSGSILWRAGNGGIIERSTDAGKTWVSQMSPSQEDWLAGSAVSDTVCWVVGRNGTIARTVDGEHWGLVPPPAQASGNAGKFTDWTGITAPDGLNATITASDGHKFATADGGKTWRTQ